MGPQAKKEIQQAIKKGVKNETASVRRANERAVAAASEEKPITSNDTAEGYKNDHIHAGVHLAQLEELTTLQAEIEESDNTSPTRVTEPCRVELQSGKRKRLTRYFVINQAPIDGLITRRSPLGKAIADKEVGFATTVETPDGPLRYKITKIS